MADLQETQQEREARWTAQRTVRDTQEQNYRSARARTRGRKGVVVGVIAVIVVVIAAIILF